MFTEMEYWRISSMTEYGFDYAYNDDYDDDLIEDDSLDDFKMMNF